MFPGFVRNFAHPARLMNWRCPNCGKAIEVNSNQFKAWLSQQGCTFETKSGGSGHLIARLGNRKTDLPMHGGSKQLGTGLVNKIKKDLGLK
jgi:mRNA interferase HicA